MGITDDHIKQALDKLSEERDADVTNETLFATIASVPFVGGAASSLLTGRAIRRIADRAEDVFRELAERLHKVEKEKIDEDYFRSDEFMTILLLSIEQLQTTHDKKKLKMIADALANSGLKTFSSEHRKELFLRILRELSPQHVSVLAAMGVNAAVCEQKDPTGERLSVLQSLVAHGLVEDFYQPDKPRFSNRRITSQSDAEELVATAIQDLEFTHIFRISSFGLAFLKFFDSASPEQKS
jgi:hypothetical protein